VTGDLAWTCPTCAVPIATPFCAVCGEPSTRTRRLGLGDLGGQAFKAVTNIDGALLRSLRLLVTRPGKLTVAYLEGSRKPYLGPLQLFLVANAAFFAVQSMLRTSILASPLSSHMAEQDWSPIARALTHARVAAKKTTLEAFRPLFDQAAVLNAKTLIILMVLALSALLPIAFLRARRPFAAHVIFALHFYAFVLLLFCLSLGLAEIQLLMGGDGLASPWVDRVLSVFNLAAIAAWLYVAVGAVYGARGVFRIASVAALTVTVAALVLGYRFAIFLITLYTV
jgi:hypothetical protein